MKNLLKFGTTMIILLITLSAVGQRATTLSGTQNPQVVNLNGGYNNGIGSKSTFIRPIVIATTKESVSFVVDSQVPVVRKIAADGLTIEDAGTHEKSPTTFQFTGWGYADGFNTNVRINNPMGACSDSSGNIIFADTYNNMIRKRLTTGEYIVIAGSLTAGSADGQGTTAQFNKPQGVCIDATGNIWVADTGNKRVRKISTTGQVTTILSTITGLKCPTSLSVDSDDNIWVNDKLNYNIKKITPSGTVTVVASGVTANGMIRDSKGNLFFTDASANNIKFINTAGLVNIYLANTIIKDGTVKRNLFEEPYGIAIDALDNLYITNTGNQWITKISPN